MAKGLGHTEFNEFKPYDFTEANRKYIQDVFKGSFVVGARSRVGIITCCDARSSPDHFFQLPENEVFIIRNGGGRTASDDVIRTIASIEILSDIKELKVIHHTDCGSLSCSNEWLKAKIAENDPHMKDGPFLDGAHMWAQSLAFLPFDWKEGESERQVLERSVIDDVQFLRNHRLIKPVIPITGWVFNQETGEVEEIDCGLENGLDLGLIQKLKEQMGTRINGDCAIKTAH